MMTYYFRRSVWGMVLNALSLLLLAEAASAASSPSSWSYAAFKSPVGSSSLLQYDADALCARKGGYLGTIVDQVEEAQIQEDLTDPVSGAWMPTRFARILTGGSDTNEEGIWRWAYGPPGIRGEIFWNSSSYSSEMCSPDNNTTGSYYCDWGPGEPNNANNSGYPAGEDVLVLTHKAGVAAPNATSVQWNDIPDGYHTTDFYYLCQFRREPPPSNITWYYRAYETATGAGSLRQSDAAVMCEARGGYLGTLRTLEEEKWIKQGLTDPSTGIWIPTSRVLTGGSDAAEEGIWRWTYGPPGVNGTIFWNATLNITDADNTTETRCDQPYCHWARGEPNNAQNFGNGTGENVLVVAAALEWNDIPDGWKETSWYMCQFDSPPPPTEAPPTTDVPPTTVVPPTTAVPPATGSPTQQQGSSSVSSGDSSDYGSEGAYTAYETVGGVGSLKQADAASLCKQKGGSLGTVTSVGQQRRLQRDLTDPQTGKWIPTSRVLTGGSDAAKEGIWRWTYGPPGIEGNVFWNATYPAGSRCQQSFCHWGTGEPNNAHNFGNSTGESVLAVAAALEWNDIPDGWHDTTWYLCQFEAPTVTHSVTLSITPSISHSLTGHGGSFYVRNGAAPASGSAPIAVIAGSILGVIIGIAMIVVVGLFVTRRARRGAGGLRSIGGAEDSLFAYGGLQASDEARSAKEVDSEMA